MIVRIIIGHIALLEEEKRQETVIRTVASLCQKGYDAYCVLVGKSYSSDGYERRLHTLVNDMKLDSRVVFLGYRNDVHDIMRGFDAIMIPASFEGFPLAGLEACCAGVPVVACDTGGAKEFIKVSQAGDCFRFDDPDDAAEKVVLCVRQRDKFRANGVKFAEANTFTIYSEKLVKLFTYI